jgi:hypothetical protein
MDCYPGEKPDAEFPFPEQKQMDCYPGEECQGLQLEQGLQLPESAQLVLEKLAQQAQLLVLLLLRQALPL